LLERHSAPNSNLETKREDKHANRSSKTNIYHHRVRLWYKTSKRSSIVPISYSDLYHYPCHK